MSASTQSELRNGACSRLIEFSRFAKKSDDYLRENVLLLGSEGRALLEKIFKGAGAPDAHIAHRVLVVCSASNKSAVGLVQALGTDLFGCVMSSTWNGGDLQILYQRSVIKGEDPSWILTSPAAGIRLFPQDVRALAVPGDFRKVQAAIVDALRRSFYWIVDYRETNAHDFLSDEFDYRLGRVDKPQITGEDFAEMISDYLTGIFSHHHESWRKEWPRIKAELTARVQALALPRAKFSVRKSRLKLLRESVVPVYQEHYRLCRRYIGTPTNFSIQAEQA
jgi:hypothetical protein